jgi:molecular chaperone GrpE
LLVLADFINYRKRVDQERNEYKIIANKYILLQITEVLDDFDRAVKGMDPESGKGITLIYDKLLSVLHENGLEKFSVNIGDVFDTQKMEAVTTLSAGDNQKGKVVDVLQNGYVYSADKRIFKMAKVVTGQ